MGPLARSTDGQTNDWHLSEDDLTKLNPLAVGSDIMSGQITSELN